MGKDALHMVSMSVKYKRKWTPTSYAAGMLKVDAKLRQSLREFRGITKHR